MASIRITIETDGAAFREHGQLGTHRLAKSWEIARVLRTIADDFERYVRGDTNSSVRQPRDINGNVCGKVEVID